MVSAPVVESTLVVSPTAPDAADGTPPRRRQHTPTTPPTRAISTPPTVPALASPVVIRSAPLPPAPIYAVNVDVGVQTESSVRVLEGYFKFTKAASNEEKVVEVVPALPKDLPEWEPPSHLARLARPAIQSAINRIAIHSPRHLLEPKHGQEYPSVEAGESSVGNSQVPGKNRGLTD